MTSPSLEGKASKKKGKLIVNKTEKSTQAVQRLFNKGWYGKG